MYPTRDFNYVRDTVRGFVAVAECEAALGQVVNVGSNHEISVGDTARMISEIMGRILRSHRRSTFASGGKRGRAVVGG